MSIEKEEERAVRKVLREGKLSGFLGRHNSGFLGGPMVRKLEEMFEDAFGVNYAVSFNSATTALQAAIRALNIGPGDQVITAPMTMTATASVILFNNAVPVFADIDPKTYCLSAETIEKKITSQTKAILVVNLFGGSADYDPIMELAKKNNLAVIEDCAQSPGGTYKKRLLGTIGDIGVFSFNVHKTIQCGEGGMLVTNWVDVPRRAQLVRNHGEVVMDDVWEEDDPFESKEFILGNNFRLTEIQAAIMVEQLKKLKKLNDERIALADYFTSLIKKVEWLEPVYVLPDSRHVYYLYPIKYKEDIAGVAHGEVVKAMAKKGYNLNDGYQKPLYLFPIYQQKRIYSHTQFPFVSSEFPQDVDYSPGICPVAERVYYHELFAVRLCQPPNTGKDLKRFIKILKNTVQSLRRGSK